MHLYVLARGINSAMRQWVEDVSAIFLPIEYAPGKKGKVRVAVRPIQLYEIVFPEEHEEFMLGAIQDNGHDGVKNKWLKGCVKVLRGFLGVKKTTRVKNNGAIFNPHVMLTHIGIKKDERDKDGIEIL